jgi:hypothetical protein
MKPAGILPVSVFVLARLWAAAPPPVGYTAEHLRKLPLAFETNRGQAVPSTDFLARGAGYQVALSRGNLIGNHPTRWCTGIPAFARVAYSSVYPGIDLAYYGNEGRLEYDFIVAPGANPAAIWCSIPPAANTASSGR